MSLHRSIAVINVNFLLTGTNQLEDEQHYHKHLRHSDLHHIHPDRPDALDSLVSSNRHKVRCF